MLNGLVEQYQLHGRIIVIVLGELPLQIHTSFIIVGLIVHVLLAGRGGVEWSPYQWLLHRLLHIDIGKAGSANDLLQQRIIPFHVLLIGHSISKRTITFMHP